MWETPWPLSHGPGEEFSVAAQAVPSLSTAAARSQKGTAPRRLAELQALRGLASGRTGMSEATDKLGVVALALA